MIEPDILIWITSSVTLYGMEAIELLIDGVWIDTKPITEWVDYTGSALGWVSACAERCTMCGIRNDATTALAAGELPWQGEVMQFAGRTAVQNDIGLSFWQTNWLRCCGYWWWCGFAMQSMLACCSQCCASLYCQSAASIAEVFYIALLYAWRLYSADAWPVVLSFICGHLSYETKSHDKLCGDFTNLQQ